jgi:hypothetical protein
MPRPTLVATSVATATTASIVIVIVIVTHHRVQYWKQWALTVYDHFTNQLTIDLKDLTR